jgi:hypothetical protein
MDQTGAVAPNSQGMRAMPLPWAAVVADSPETPRIHLPQSPLPKLSFSALQQEKNRLQIAGPFALLLDCVLGLPEALGQRAYFNALESLQACQDPFGRTSAEQFFSKLLGDRLDNGTLPTRLCEVVAGANSVFRTRPSVTSVENAAIVDN